MKKLITLKSLLLLINILFLNVFTAVAQQSYSAYNSSVKTDIFSDNFNNNTNQWITDNLWIKGTISGGYYSITCKNYQMSTGLSYKPIPIDPNVDFGIETEVKIIKGTGALVFGMNDKYDHYRVELSDKNTLEVLKDTPSKKKKVEKLFTGTGSIPVTRELNKITVVRIQGVFYVYVNEFFVNQFSNIQIEGNQIGFNVGTESEISVDYLRVAKLESKAVPMLAQNEQTQQVVTTETIKPQSPVITWINPTKANTTLKSTNSSIIQAKINSPYGIQSVVLYLNGVSYGYPEMTPSTTEPGVFIIEKAINFDAGENNIFVEATNQGGLSTSEKRYFTIPTSPAPITASSNQAVQKTDENRGITSPSAPVIKCTTTSGANTTLESFNANVKATVKSSSGLKSVLLYMNGISKGETDIKLVPNETGSFQVEKNLNFGPGENQIYLVATNSEGATKSEVRYFTNPFAVAPVVSWSNPTTPNTLVNTESLTIGACIKSPSDLRSVKILINGTIFSEDNVFQASTSGDCNYSW